MSDEPDLPEVPDHTGRRSRRLYVRGTPQERFAARLRPGPLMPGMTTPCIEWIGAKNAKGYGKFSIPGAKRHKLVLAHRYAIEQAHGSDPRPVLHACDNPGCCNPDHLRYGTRTENNADMVARDRVARGEQKSQAVLTDAFVLVARERARRGESLASIARDLGFGVDTVRHSVRGNTWPHLPGAVPPRWRMPR